MLFRSNDTATTEIYTPSNTLTLHDALPISFQYLSVAELFTTLGTDLAGLALAWWYVRRPEPLLMRAAWAMHTGSVNDYAGYAVLGIVVTVTALLLL